jgi:transcriptional regulator with XRE-family HTH domain
VYYLTVFSKNLKKLREEKKISQKSAAASLGVSQALLSHYEKGIRECGLDFLCRAARYYEVTADFMLGLSNEPDLIKAAADKKDGSTYTMSVLYKNLIIHALAYIFDSMKDLKYKDVAVLSGKYLTLAIYRLCGILYAGLDKPVNLSERHIISELEYIIEIENLDAPLGEYNFDNPYLTNIIKNVPLE